VARPFRSGPRFRGNTPRVKGVKGAYLSVSVYVSLRRDDKELIGRQSTPNRVCGSSCRDLEDFHRHSPESSSDVRNDTARAANYTYSWTPCRGIQIT